MMTPKGGGSGNDDKFRELYGRYYARMLRYFRRVFRLSEEDAEELTQDSFLRFYRTIEEYRGEAEWALLETIARNVGFNRVRSRKTLKRGVKTESLDDPDAAPREPEAKQPGPLEGMIEKDQKKRLREAIALLPPGQRACMSLWLEDYSYEEIAGLLHFTVDAVRSRIRDAKKLLRERLGDEGVLPEE